MIFITLGSQKFQFDRLLKEVDILVNEKIIDDEVFAQIGYSNYKPTSYICKRFLDREEFNMAMDKASIVITHGGTGAIVGALKKNKKVIAIPRLSKFGEHVDDHQLQITAEFKKSNLILAIDDIKELKIAMKKVNDIKLYKYISNTENIICSIEEYINKIKK